MMRTQQRSLAGMAFALAALATVHPTAARQAVPPGDQARQQGSLDAASKAAADSSIPAPGAISVGTTARAFVESFIVGLAQRTPNLVHETYLAPALRSAMPLESFVAELRDLRAAAGPLTRLSVTYLRQRNAAKEGEVDGGWATYLGAFERDPRVAVRVDFERGPEGLWQVTSFTVDSPQLERLRKARAEAESSAIAPATGTEPAPPPAPRSPASAESGGGR